MDELSKQDRASLRLELTRPAVNMGWCNVENTLALLDTCDALEAARDRDVAWIRDNAIKQWEQWKDDGCPGTWPNCLAEGLAASQKGAGQ